MFSRTCWRRMTVAAPFRRAGITSGLGSGLDLAASQQRIAVAAWTTQRLQSSSTSASSLKCPVCGRTFAAQATLNTHMEVRHATSVTGAGVATPVAAPMPAPAAASALQAEEAQPQPPPVEAPKVVPTSEVPSTPRVAVASGDTLERALQRALQTHTTALRAARLAVELCRLRVQLGERLQRQSGPSAEQIHDPMVVDARPFGGPVPGERPPLQPGQEAVRIGSTQFVQMVGHVRGSTKRGRIANTPVLETIVSVNQFSTHGPGDRMARNRSDLTVRLYGDHAALEVKEHDVLLLHGMLGLHPAFSLDEAKWADEPVIHVFGTAGLSARLNE